MVEALEDIGYKISGRFIVGAKWRGSSHEGEMEGKLMGGRGAAGPSKGLTEGSGGDDGMEGDDEHVRGPSGAEAIAERRNGGVVGRGCGRRCRGGRMGND